MSTHLEIELHSRPEAPRPAVVEIRYGQVGLVQVRISTTDPGAILDELTGRVATAPHFFRRTAVCLELAALETTPDVAAVQAVIDALRRAGMLVVGLSGDLAALDTLSSGLNLPVVSTFRTAGRAVPIVQPVASAPERPPAPPEPAPVQEQPGAAALIHTQTVRSGQRIHARHRDLIVTASVGAGAEVMADGCVHVYGSLRGRAMAGVHGQLSARVFCQQFYAELVSIAGIFRVFETLPPELSGAPVQAWLMGEDLHVVRLK